ncbi:MAG: hypothetical protein EOP48_11685, partial [Sphingobacteriales bacterium]
MEKYRYKKSGIEYLGEIPEHWKVIRLSCLGSFEKGRGIAKSDLLEGLEKKKGLPAIVYGDIYTKYEIKTSLLVNRISFETSKNATPVYNGNLLLTGSGETKEEIGKCVLYRSNEKAFAGGDIIIFKTNYDSPEFLSYVLNSHSSIYQKVIAATGDIVVHIYASKLGNIKLSLPPLQEQKSIAEYLEKACARIDRIISVKEDQLRKIKAIRKAKIDELVRFGVSDTQEQNTDLPYLPKIKSGWKKDRLKDLISLRDEKTGEKSQKEDYLELEDMEQGTGRILNKRNTLEVESKVTRFYKGDVLFGKLRPYLEKYHLAEFDGKCTGEILAFRPFKINGKYLMYIFASKWFIDLCNSMAYGAVVTVYYDSLKTQFTELNPCRGYLGSVGNRLQFGFGAVTKIDSIRIVWPDHTMQLVVDPAIDKFMAVAYKQGLPRWNFEFETTPALFENVTTGLSEEGIIDFTHQETDFIDFNEFRLLPHKFSQYGPSLAVGDVNGDKLEDVFIGGSKGFEGRMLLQDRSGKFSVHDLNGDLVGSALQKENPAKVQEDQGSLLADFDRDGHVD